MRRWGHVGERTWVLLDDETGQALAGVTLLDGSSQPAPLYRVTGELVDEPQDFATLVAAQVFVEALAGRRDSGGVG